MGSSSQQPDVRPDPRPANAAIFHLAARQHGVVARAQLLESGVARWSVDRLVAAGWLRRIHRGVYGVGPTVPPRGREMAACLACAPTGAISHGNAGGLWQQVERPPEGALVDVTTTGVDRRRPGLRVHRVGALPPDEVTELDGIPVTTPARTLLDLAPSLPRRALERAVAETLARRLARPARIRALLDRHPRRRGTAALCAVLDVGHTDVTRSHAEERFLALVRKAGLDPPELNVRLEGFEVDALFRRERLVVEIDGAAFHAAPARFEGDRRRDAVLLARGFVVMRITWRQLADEPEAVLVRLVRALMVARPGGR